MKDAAPRRYYTRDACLNSRVETGRQDPARFRFGEPVGGNRTSAGGIVLTGGCANAACIVVKSDQVKIWAYPSAKLNQNAAEPRSTT